MKNTDILEIRASNLKRILSNEYGGDRDRLIKTIDVSPTAFTKYLNSNSDRPCGDNAARRIERRLGLSYEYLDHLHNRGLEIYFISVDIDVNFSYQIIDLLRNEPNVQECWLTIGEHDLLLKVAVENYRFLDLLLSSLSKFPGFKNTRSFQTVGSMSWQRSQPEKMEISKRNEHHAFSNGIQAFKHKKAEQYFSQIEKLYSDETIVKREDIVSLHSFEFIRGTRKTLLSTRYLGLELTGQNKFEEKESELISNGVKSKRIIALKNDTKSDNVDLIKVEYERYRKMNCAVRFLFYKDWRPTTFNDSPEFFNIMDGENIVIRNEREQKLIVSSSKLKIDEYTLSFNANWKIAKSFEAIKTLLTKNDS